MIEFKRVLVPTDFSEPSRAALRYGVELARRFHARLYLLHVVDNPGEAMEADDPIGTFETMQIDAYEWLPKLLSRDELSELRPECAMRIGAAADEIGRYALEHHVDLIVMGTHGREGVARVLLGSVAETVVRRASCPVLTVHHPEHEFVTTDVPVRAFRRARASCSI